MTTLTDIPGDPTAFAEATWDDIGPLYDALAEWPLEGDTAIREWLAAWSRLEAAVTEAASLAMIAYTGNTADEEAQAAHLRFSSQIFPQLGEESVRLARRLVASGYHEPGLEVTLARFRRDIELFREASVPLFATLESLASRYQEITGGMTAPWEGERLPLPQLQPFLQSPDRAVRERAFRVGTEAYVKARVPLAALFDQMYDLRQRVASNAGFADYQGYAFAAKYRFDYDPEDCRRFHDAVEAVVVPAVTRLHAWRRERLGVDRLRPWDLNVDPLGRPPVRPFRDQSEFIAKTQRLFNAMDPELGREFRLLAEEGMLDLVSRTGKAPGGYCDTLHVRGRPFIFMNAVGLLDDVRTLLHESGHAFHAFAAHDLPFIWQRYAGAEVSELTSMTMELLAAPLLVSPAGFLTPEESRDAWAEQLEDLLVTLTHIASVDAYQSWLYTSGEGGDASARDAGWLGIRERFEPAVDWSGLEAERAARWYRQLHIFLYPFYYIEYGIAQLGAVQLWRASRRDHDGTLAAYRQALALGGTASLPEVYRTAGAELIFDRDRLAELVTDIEAEIDLARRA